MYSRSMRGDWSGNPMAMKGFIMALCLLVLGFSVSSLRLPGALAAESAETVGQNSRIDSIRQELTRLRGELALKQGKYSNKHRDVQRVKREIERLEHDLETASPPKPAAAIPPSVQRHTPGLRAAGRVVEVKPGPHTLADTIAFSSSSTLIGHGGKDWNPKTGDVMQAIKGDNGKWYCTIISSSNNAVVSQRSH